MNLTSFFEQRPVFSHEEYKQFLQSLGTTNPNTQRELLAYHLKKQHILRIKRGLFASIPMSFRNSVDNFPVDSYLIAGRIRNDAVISYLSALDFHGVSYSLHHQYYFMSESVIAPFKFNEDEFICLSFPKALTEQQEARFEVLSADRHGLDIHVTSLERTIVDVLDRPNYGGGWEEIWRSAEHISILNLDKVIEYANLLNNASTIAKLGFFLEQFKEQFFVDESILSYLEQKKPTGIHYLERSKRESGKHISRWNLVVPYYIIERSWEEPNEDF
ncbi:TPA: transcriptional regulator [Legionella pneumophila]|uniref:type IV toxin-antitoxin system AbiEi family antitoxin domain-containing protein n=1 Tax=Legionella pneumophila TaxID=446 RepID=UPI000777872C|nr:type IV toxin-antitoxin system AbiEi family antitoxin [Legionella pneumophila]HAT8648906.1 transcriptional regulator [Legionella pneumophila]